MRQSLLTIALLMLALLSPGTAAQTVHHVPGDFGTIQDAINASANGDTVLVARKANNAPYTENLDFNGRAITVTSDGTLPWPVIDGGAKTAVVSFHSNESRNSVLRNFTIRNGGVTSADETSPEGGIYIYNASPTIQQNALADNTCNGIEVAGGTPLLTGNQITTTQNNALCFDIDYQRSAGNFYYGGSAIFLRKGSSSTTSFMVLSGNTLENNTAAVAAGGILSLSNGWLGVGNLIRNNLGGNAGALAHYVAFGGFTFVNNILYGNGPNDTGFYKAAVDLDTNGEIFSGIGAFGIYFDNNTLANDTVSSGFSYATELALDSTPSNVELANNIIVGGTIGIPAVYCAPSYLQEPGDVLAAANNDIFNPARGASAAGICGPTAGTYGNLSVDPMFNAPASGDFHLKQGSPAIDAGNDNYSMLVPSPFSTIALPPATTDFDGNPRVQDATGTLQGIIDMGALEYPATNQPVRTLIVSYPDAYEINAGPVTLYALMSGAASGVVDFIADGKQIGSAALRTDGTTALTYNGFAPGVHEIVATFEGTAFSPATTSTPYFVLVDKYSPTLLLSTSVTPSPQYQPVTITATIHSPDTNQLPVELFDENGAIDLGPLTPNANGIATYTTSTLSAGTHDLMAYYAGDAEHNPVRALLTQKITPGVAPPPQNTATDGFVTPGIVTFGDLVAVGANVFPSPHSASGPPGSVAFTDNGVPLTNVPLTLYGGGYGSGALKSTTFAVGTHTFVATYLPTDPTAYITSVSPPFVLIVKAPVVVPPSFTLSANPQRLTIKTEHHGSTILTLTSLNGFSGEVSMSCGTLPPSLTCELPGYLLTLTSGGSATSTLTLDTDVLLNFASTPSDSNKNGIAWATLLPLALLGLGRKRRRVAWLLLLAALTLNVTACSSKYPDHTPPGTYVIPITATSGNQAQSLNLTLVVTP